MSINIGRFVAGADVSTVPSSAIVEIDRRIVPGEDPSGCVREIEALVAELLVDYPGVTSGMETFLAGPAFLTPLDDPLVLALERAVAAAGGKSGLTGYRQASDARFLANDGIPIVIFGPSDPEVGHAFDEYVAVRELEIATDVLVRFARQAFGG